MTELAVIAAAPWSEPPYVVIDDMHMFKPWEPGRVDLGFDPSDWPMLDQVRRALENFTLFEADDVLYAFPMTGRDGPMRS